jgi:hypothetical protein
VSFCHRHADHGRASHEQSTECMAMPHLSAPVGPADAQHSTDVIAYGHPLMGLSRHLRQTQPCRCCPTPACLLEGLLLLSRNETIIT